MKVGWSPTWVSRKVPGTLLSFVFLVYSITKNFNIIIRADGATDNEHPTQEEEVTAKGMEKYPLGHSPFPQHLVLGFP